MWWSYEHLIVICYFHTAGQNCWEDLKYGLNALKQEIITLLAGYTFRYVLWAKCLEGQIMWRIPACEVMTDASRTQHTQTLKVLTGKIKWMLRRPDHVKNSCLWSYDWCQPHATHPNTKVLTAKIKWMLRRPDHVKNSCLWSYDWCQPHATHPNTKVLTAKIKWYQAVSYTHLTLPTRRTV